MASLPMLVFCSALLALLSYVSYLRLFHPLARFPGPFPASVTRLWLVYQARTLQRHRIEMDLHQKYGPFVRISPNEVSIADPKYVKILYGAGSPFLKSRWYETVGPKDEDAMNLLGEPNMEKYRLQRRLIGPMFTTQAVKARENLLEGPIVRFVAKMEGMEGQPLDLVKWMNILAIDLLTEITFSESMDFVSSGNDRDNAKDVDDFWHQIHWIGLLPDFWLFYTWITGTLESLGLKFFFKADISKLSIIQVLTLIHGLILSPCSLLQYYITQLTQRHTETPEEGATHADLASDILRSAAARPECKPQWATTITMHIIGAGFDTLGMTLGSCLAWVAKTPGCQAKLHREMDKARNEGRLDDIAPSYDQAHALPYLQSCIHEAMRLNPVIGISLPRVVPPEGAIINDQHIPGGTIVGINPWIVHRDKDIYGVDADEFRPERYSKADDSQLHAMDAVSLAFGGPSRSCPGRYLAWVALSKTCAAIFLHFEVEILGDEEAREHDGDGFREECFFVVKWYGVWMRLKKRT